MKKNNKLKKCFVSSVSLLLLLLAFVCLFTQIQKYLINPDYVRLATAKTTMTGGHYKYEEIQQKGEPETEAVNNINPNTQDFTDNIAEKQQKSTDSDNSDHTGEKTYPVIEETYSKGNMSYENIAVKNSTDYSMNIKKLLSEPLGFEFDASREIQVLIVHTHTEESYLDYDKGYYYESYYPRSSNDEKNMVQVGEKIAQRLKAHNIGVVHDKTHHDATYNGAYDRSYNTIMKYIKKYPNIKVILDIHRDSITREDNTKVKPIFTYNGKKAAQIMIMTGYDEDGSYNYPDWNYNLRFALRLQQKAEEMYPGMTRPLYFGDFVYNLNVNTGSLLIEVGTDSNTLDEAKYTGELLGNALSEVLQS